MGRVMFGGGKIDMSVPVGGILLSSIAEGSIVKLNENGSPIEFYVACHNYESALNGDGRTLLVRKDCYDTRIWHSSKVNAWLNCTLHSWLNSDYLNMFNINVKDAIGTTKYYYTPGNSNWNVTTNSDAIFQLSVTEFNDTNTYANTEGAPVPIASALRIAYYNGSVAHQWTRSPSLRNTENAFLINGRSGSAEDVNCTGTVENVMTRPVFTLPSTSLFDKSTLLFKGVA